MKKYKLKKELRTPWGTYTPEISPKTIIEWEADFALQQGTFIDERGKITVNWSNNKDEWFEEAPERIELRWGIGLAGDDKGPFHTIAKRDNNQFTKEEIKKMEAALNNECWTAQEIYDTLNKHSRLWQLTDNIDDWHWQISEILKSLKKLKQ